MHFEFLVEDRSGSLLVESLVPRILGKDHTFRVKPYRGLGHLPKGLKPKQDPAKRLLLDQLPKLISGYGRTPGIDAVVFVIDADNRPCADFLKELVGVLHSCHPRPPRTLFRLAIEEIEAWLLGDTAAVRVAYSNAKAAVLEGYQQDSICGTWEVLADAVYAGGRAALTSQSYQVVGEAKSEWAARIGPHLDLERNASPSFRKFRQGLVQLSAKGVTPFATASPDRRQRK